MYCKASIFICILITWTCNPFPQALNRALECLLSPCSVKEERILRAIYKSENISPTEKSKLLVEKIKEIGLEPYKKPDIYPTIDKDMIHLVCWLGLTK